MDRDEPWSSPDRFAEKDLPERDQLRHRRAGRRAGGLLPNRGAERVGARADFGLVECRQEARPRCCCIFQSPAGGEGGDPSKGRAGVWVLALGFSRAHCGKPTALREVFDSRRIAPTRTFQLFLLSFIAFLVIFALALAVAILLLDLLQRGQNNLIVRVHTGQR